MKNMEKTSEEARNTLLLAYLCIKDLAGLPEQVAILDRFNFSSAQIATVCGVVEGSVRNARMLSKKAKLIGNRANISSTNKE